MKFPGSRLKAVLFASLIIASAPLDAQTTHTVMVEDNFFDPAEITIAAGDTVRWVNPPGGMMHNVIADDFSFSSGGVSTSFTYEQTFTEAGTIPYFCQPHRVDDMTGTITVTGSTGGGGGGVDLNPGHNGNWWNGLPRDGEGVQLELSDAGGGQLVFVATIYSYGPQGGQIFMIAVGTPDGDSVEADVFITEGGVWGDDLDPADISQIPWGTAIFTADGCDLISMILTPNATYLAQGFTVLSYDLVRLTTSSYDCPKED